MYTHLPSAADDEEEEAEEFTLRSLLLPLALPGQELLPTLETS